MGLAAASTVGQKLTGTKTERAAIIGAEIAKKAKVAKIKTVVFDRAHGDEQPPGRKEAAQSG